jgi:hypothetical protein
MFSFLLYILHALSDNSTPEDTEQITKVQKKSRSKIKSSFILEVDDDDLPILPADIPESRNDVESVIRQFFTGYYSGSVSFIFVVHILIYQQGTGARVKNGQCLGMPFSTNPSPS